MYCCFTEYFGGGFTRLPTEDLIQYIANKHPLDFFGWCSDKWYAHTIFCNFVLDGDVLYNNGTTNYISTDKDDFRLLAVKSFCETFYPDFHIEP